MNKRSRYLISAGVFAVCICAAWIVVAMLPPRHGVTKGHFDRIEKGMTWREVQIILGQANADALLSKNGIEIVGCPDESEFQLIDEMSDGSTAALLFQNNRLTDKGWGDSTETVPDKLRRWLHLPK